MKYFLTFLCIFLLSAPFTKAESIYTAQEGDITYSAEIISHGLTEASVLIASAYDYINNSDMNFLCMEGEWRILQDYTSTFTNARHISYTNDNTSLILSSAPTQGFTYSSASINHMLTLHHIYGDFPSLQSVYGSYSQHNLDFMSKETAIQNMIVFLENATGLSLSPNDIFSISKAEYDIKAAELSLLYGEEWIEHAQITDWPDNDVCYAIYLNQIIEGIPVFHFSRPSDISDNWVDGCKSYSILFWNGTFESTITGGYEIIETCEPCVLLTPEEAIAIFNDYWTKRLTLGNTELTVDQISLQYVPYEKGLSPDGTIQYSLSPTWVFRALNIESFNIPNSYKYNIYFVDAITGKVLEMQWQQ